MIDPHDMMCQELVEVLTEYLDATLGAHDRARLEAHLDGLRRLPRGTSSSFRRRLCSTGRADSGALPPTLRDDLSRASVLTRVRTAFRTH